MSNVRVCVCVIRLSAFNMWTLRGWIFMKFRYSIFKYLEKIQVSLKTLKILHQDQLV